MSTLTLSPRLFDPVAPLVQTPVVGPPPAPAPAVSPPDPSRLTEGPTLDDVIAASWRQITAGAPASCPVCHGDLKPVWTGGLRPVGGRCQDCGSRLS